MSASHSPLQADRCALIIAHPGHELLVHGWLERARPLVVVLTDGSGGTGRPRLASTTRVLEAAGATPASIYGHWSDRAAYDLILDQQFDAITSILQKLTCELVTHRVQCVVGDAAEGHNPAHDLCRLLIDAAVARAGRRGHGIQNYVFPQVGKPDGSDRAQPGHQESVLLDSAALARKLAAASGYPEMAGEVARAIAAHGVSAFQTEHFFRAVGEIGSPHLSRPPYYETFGAGRVAEGRYARILRYEHHMAPLERHLRQVVTDGEPCETSSPMSAD